MVGFQCGVVLCLASPQLPKLFGVRGKPGNFWQNSGARWPHAPATQPASIIV
jgi:MFS superfamily sulfate permease-like transporter